MGEVELVHIRPTVEDDAPRAQVPAEVLKGCYAWELVNPVRYDEPLPALVKPYGSWFYPFQRRTSKS
ncbi:hypothetical protein [Polystyrenella longa]|uniref:hypothetical protein n=1 Tax=Polystyrenella longa TaxID=2528007 RepID=UPI0011A699C3|nr:hypothetical protein [Polystyrenella longa]